MLQLVMGWEDCHMHDFRIGQRRFGKPEPRDRLPGLPAVDKERTVRLFSVLGRVGAKAVYTYDFGDSWEHAITVEKMMLPEPGLAYPVCIDGKRHGPPEDCGGVPGFYNLLEAISDSRHDEHEELRDWIGGDYDPGAFSLDECQGRSKREPGCQLVMAGEREGVALGEGVLGAIEASDFTAVYPRHRREMQPSYFRWSFSAHLYLPFPLLPTSGRPA